MNPEEYDDAWWNQKHEELCKAHLQEMGWSTSICSDPLELLCWLEEKQTMENKDLDNENDE